jgi:hypothetical protein
VSARSDMAKMGCVSDRGVGGAWRNEMVEQPLQPFPRGVFKGGGTGTGGDLGRWWPVWRACADDDVKYRGGPSHSWLASVRRRGRCSRARLVEDSTRAPVLFA